MTKSLQHRLLILLSLAIIATNTIQFIASFSVAMTQTNRLFDSQMQQVAQSLRQVRGQGTVMSEIKTDFDLVIQIWRDEAVQVFQERRYRMLPDRAAEGFSTVTLANGEWRVYAERGTDSVVQIAQKIDARRKEAISVALNTLWPMLLMSVVLLLLIRWIVSISFQPLGAVRQQLSAREAASLAPVVGQDIPTEISPIIEALNALLARTHEAIDLQRQFIADAAHELRSPLTVLRMQIQLLARAKDEAGRDAAIQLLADAIDRSSRVVAQLLTLARQDALQEEQRPKVTTDLSLCVADALAEVASFATDKGIELSFLDATTIKVSIDPDSLMILLRNLLDNAVRYTPAEGAVTVSVENRGELAVLSIADSGPGIPAVDIPRVTNRFYRVPGTIESGSGLGLAIVRIITERFHAKLQLYNSITSGLVVKVAFPASSSVERG